MFVKMQKISWLTAKYQSEELCKFLIWVTWKYQGKKYSACKLFGLLSKPQQNLNATIRFYAKITLHHHPTPQPIVGCYWPDFDQTLKVGSWEHLEHIPTVMVTFVQAAFVQATFVQAAFVQATFVPPKFVHIGNVLSVTDLTLSKL